MTPELIATHARSYWAKGRFDLAIGLQRLAEGVLGAWV